MRSLEHWVADAAPVTSHGLSGIGLVNLTGPYAVGCSMTVPSTVSVTSMLPRVAFE